jgi:tRNA (guanine-N7-)-methyltransferase
VKEEPIRYGTMADRPPGGPVELRTLATPGDGDLELEIGFGLGRFLLERAAAAPASRIVGVEIKAKLAYHVEKRIEKLAVPNARAWVGDARELLARSGPDACLSRVFVHFPDPWWKKRHAKRRVIDAGMTASIARLLRPGGELFVQTDVEERFEEMAAEIGKDPRFAIARLEATPYGARSTREVRAEADGLPIYRFVARRR